MSRLAVGPTQPPIQWMLGAEHEADHSPPSSAKVKNAWSYASMPSWHGAQLKKKAQGQLLLSLHGINHHRNLKFYVLK